MQRPRLISFILALAMAAVLRAPPRSLRRLAGAVSFALRGAGLS
jgi:hypothetical protein